MKRKHGIPVIVAAVFVAIAGIIYLATHIGPGSLDFRAKLAGPYFLHRMSSQEVLIAPDTWDGSIPIIPTLVVACGTDRRFIVAKRQGLKRKIDNGPQSLSVEPDPNTVDYWILDTAAPKVFGPLTLEQFNDKRTALGVPSSLALKDINTFRPLL